MADLLVRGFKPGPPGASGISGYFIIGGGSALTLPAAGYGAAGAGVTVPSLSTGALSTGQQLFVTVPNVGLCILENAAGTLKLTRWLPAAATSSIAVGTILTSQSGNGGTVPIAANFTIPTTGTVSVSIGIPTSYLPPAGQTLTATVKGYGGNLVYVSGSSWTFTPSNFPPSATAVVAATDYFTLVAPSTSAVSLDPLSQGLTFTSGQLGLLPTGSDINLPGRKLYTAITRPSGSAQIRLPDGTLINTNDFAPYIIDSDYKVLHYLNGETFFFADIETQYIKAMPSPNSLGLIDAKFSLDGKLLWGLKNTGEVLGIPDRSRRQTIKDSDGIFFSAELDENGLYQIYRQYGLSKVKLTTSGNNWNIFISGNFLYFTSDRSGDAQSYYCNKFSGASQFYADLYADWFDANDYKHIIQTGQSLSVGGGNVAKGISDSSYGNKMFQTGIISYATTAGSYTSLVPAQEWGNETGMVAAVNQVSGQVNKLTGANQVNFICSAHGVGSATLDVISKPSTSYSAAIAAVTAGVSLSAAASKTYQVPLIIFHHGEQDDGTSTLRNQIPNYRTKLLTYINNYNTDINALTGRSDVIPLFATQTSGWTIGSTFATPYTAIELYEAFKANPTLIYLICPKYWLSTDPTGAIHLDTFGYQALDELVGAAIFQTFVQKKPWKPLYPTSVVRTGANVKATFNVPVAPLVFDTTTITDPNGVKGFEYVNGSNVPVTINSATLDPDGVSVNLVLASATAGSLRYAYTGTVGNAPGPTTGARGCLCDSSNYPSNYNIPYPIKNWCVHFSETVA
jgi:hypothetical protein